MEKTLKQGIGSLFVTLLILSGMVLSSVPIPSAQAETVVDNCDDREGEAQERCEELKEKLADVLRLKEKNQKLYREQGQKSASISEKVFSLEAEIQKHINAIEARRGEILNLTGNIAEQKADLEILLTRINNAEDALATLIRKSDVKDNVSIVEIILRSESFSDFFTDVDEMEVLRKNIRKKLQVIQETRILTKSKKEKLVLQRVKQRSLKESQMLEKKRVSEVQDHQEVLLKRSKGKEEFYKELVAQRKEEAAQIRTELFALRDTNKAINFGRAYEIAKQVEDHTGVRPAFLLAILTQESRIGKNVGRCNIPGQTPNRMWDDIMPGPNDDSWHSTDQKYYLAITESLGIGPTTKPLSCPLSIGWGGAMGPAQFIPTTWNSFIPAIRKATGNQVPNPWNPRDAFFASGIYLQQLGAGSGTRSAEIRAAGKYYAGGNWQSLGMGYARNVQRLADNMERKIKLLEKY